MRKLVVKAANGSVDDFAIDAETNWTVKEIKAHIYRLYPTHPPVTCQKLIHGGRLLLDQSTLSEAIPFSGETSEPTIIHLVAYERSKSAPSTTALTGTAERVHSSASSATNSGRGGLRNRQGTAVPARASRDSTQDPNEMEGTNQPSQRVHPAMNPWLRHQGPIPPNQFPIPPNQFPPNQVPPTQHLPPNLMPAMQNVAAGGVANPFLQAPPFYQSPYGAIYANQMQQWYNHYYRGPVGSDNVDGEGARDVQNPLDLPVNPNDPDDLPEPEDQEDIPVNGPGGLMMAGGGGGGPGVRRRDFVDYLYMLSMIGFLILMAFLTGSLGRLLIFAAGIIFMVLNQAGFFSLQRRRQGPINPDFPRPGQRAQPGQGAYAEEREANQDEAEPRQEADQGVVEAPDGDQDALPEGLLQPRANQEQQQHQPPGVLATVLVFITSFFTSLIPQQRPELQVN